MIFVGGIHGVGKTYFCDIIKKKTGINSYTISDLIHDNVNLNPNKEVENIIENQRILLEKVKEIKDEEYILDGHFCLINKGGEFLKIPSDVFIELKPTRIIVLRDESCRIIRRRQTRDGVILSGRVVEQFQKMEIEHAKMVAEMMNIPIFIYKNGHDYKEVLNFVLLGVNNGREV